ncbi:hypothetical protein [Microbulbifer epialgicus]|uniref:Holin-X, holin superfamily III n=1 Tax=Microbulbifer epialgicus TaxID=393907 RepID=A0ABV4NU69_9GAMM
MFKNLSGEVTISWGDKTVTKSLSRAIVLLSLVAVCSIFFTALMGFLLFGFSASTFLALPILSIIGLGAAVYFGRDFLTGLIFKGQVQAESSQEKEIDSSQANES